MRGARQRAEALAQLARENGAVWQYFVGLEGGLDVVHESASPYEMVRHSASRQNGQRRRVFLESWAYVSNGARGHFGRSGGDRPLRWRRGDPRRAGRVGRAFKQFHHAAGGFSSSRDCGLCPVL